jgi:hypothetical protein
MAGAELTESGLGLRAAIEAETDALDAAPWTHLGAERTSRLIQLGKGLSAYIVGNGAFPAEGVFAARKG